MLGVESVILGLLWGDFKDRQGINEVFSNISVIFSVLGNRS